jgi:hypothetical protein
MSQSYTVSKFVADVDEIRPQYQDSAIDGSAIFTSSIIRSIGPAIGSTIDALDNLTLSEVGGSSQLATPWYSDQVLPFDITLSANNEYGANTAAKISGIEILNEGSTIHRRRSQQGLCDLHGALRRVTAGRGQPV